jgi:YVTN family beta-propeller protein
VPVALAVVGLAALGWIAVGRGDRAAQTAATTTTDAVATLAKSPAVKPQVQVLVARRTGTLSPPEQDAAPAPAGGNRILLLGGLTPADTSSDAITVADPTGGRVVARLPSALHDAAAARVGNYAYLFGGGNGTRQLDQILRVPLAGGSAVAVGRLPAPSSDQTGAAIGNTAYVVGGYTGTRWLNTIVAYTPGQTARVVARLPFTVRYAAVTAVGDRLIIAGGSLENGTASDAVLEYVPAAGHVFRIGHLPAPTTHAAAAALGNTAFIIGGRGASSGTPTDQIVAVDIATKRIRAGGTLPTPLSDLAAVTIGGDVLVAGGRSLSGTQASIFTLTPHTRSVKSVTASPTFKTSATNVYAADGADALTGAALTALPRIYVPNSNSNTVDVIDPATYKIVGHFAVGQLPQHVTPSWDLKRLYVLNDLGNSLTLINPQTGKQGATIPVDDPYNMYYTPDGRFAIVVAERLHRLDFRDAQSLRMRHSLAVPCTGVDHMDFSADGLYLIASCEFSGQMIKVNVATQRVVGVLDLPGGAGQMPQDVKLSPDGKVFYVADLRANGLWEIDGKRLRVIGFLRTGAGVHGLYPSRDAKLLYATNRGEGSISVISFRTRKVVTKWRIPGGGSPDMGGVSADGKVLWLSGRYNGVVYALSTRNGRLLARIPVGVGPHGLCVWPQPGRYSLGHTGILR